MVHFKNMQTKTLATGLKYQIARDQLLAYLRTNNYQHGYKLPTEQELSDLLQVSRTTIRQALELLQKEQIVTKRQGSGTFYSADFETPRSKPTDKGLIGVINFFFMDYLYPDIIRGIEDTLGTQGYSLVLANCNMNPEKEVEAIQKMLNQKVKGIILEPSRNLHITDTHPMITMIRDKHIPVVTTHWGISSKFLSTVTLDDVRAGHEVATYLVGKGHREVAMIYKEDVESGSDRLSGFTRGLQEAGIPIRPEWFFGFNGQEESETPLQGYKKTQELLTQCKQTNRYPSAIFYFNDFFAEQGYKAIQEFGLRIPEDISVVGFDDYRTAPVMHPPLTTFEHPKYHLGKWAAKLLIEAIELGSQAMAAKILFEPRLVERRSVKDLKS